MWMDESLGKEMDETLKGEKTVKKERKRRSGGV